MMGYGKLLALVPLAQIMLRYAAAVSLTAMGSNGGNVGKNCKRQLDFAIIVDESASISKKDWSMRMIPFLENLISEMDLDNSDIKLSLTTYSTPVRSIITFLDKEASNTQLAIKRLHDMRDSKPAHGMTYTGHAISFVRQSILPYGRKNAPKALLLITDGGSSDPDLTAQEAAMIRDEGVNVMVIGVGDVKISECRGIVGCDGVMECPMFKHTDWQGMIRLFYGFMKEVCDTLPQDAICEPVWSEWSACSGECNVAGIRRRTLVALETVKKPTVGTSGQQGRTCEDQHNDFLPQDETCVKRCDTPPPRGYDIPAPFLSGRTANGGDEPMPASPPSANGGDERVDFVRKPKCPWERGLGMKPINPRQPDIQNSDEHPTPPIGSSVLTPQDPNQVSTGTEEIPNPQDPNQVSTGTEEIPNPQDPNQVPTERVGAGDVEYYGDKNSADDDLDDTDDGTLTDDSYPQSPIPASPYAGKDPMNIGEHGDQGNTISILGDNTLSDGSDEQDDSGATGDQSDMVRKAELRRQLEREREEDLKRELQLQHNMSQEAEDKLKHQLMLNQSLGTPSDTTASPESPNGLGDGTYSLDGIEKTPGMEQPANEPTIEKDAVQGETAQKTDEATAEDTSEQSSSNTTKIAGGALLGLLLLGAGGGYAMYKKNKAPAPEVDGGDYTGADEGEQPMRDAETYTVTEFDNNIWGEAT
uniref:Thrombospondin-related anonymous protein n=1 Tax=Babesia motasi TaxID=237580 RepID=A0A221SSI7_9APIC|nr:thrombospondin-related anonymous protein [Babesia motasi]ASN79592.1 thrombospondin-related anonymous protein [Babesia motasi]